MGQHEFALSSIIILCAYLISPVVAQETKDNVAVLDLTGSGGVTKDDLSGFTNRI